MNGARRIRTACAIWYCSIFFFALAGCVLLASEPPVSTFLDEGKAAALACETKRAVGFWILLSTASAIPFVFLIHLLAAIWETLAATLGALGSLEAKVDSYSKWFIGRTLESAAPTSTPPPPTAGPTA